MTSTRRLAVIAIGEVFAGGVKPKDALERLSAGLDERDRAFLMELTYGVLRRRLTLDHLMAGYLKDPSGLSARTIDVMRAAVYQIFFMRVPEFAAVSEAVEVEKDAGPGDAGKPALVNAVLRNVLRDKTRLEGGLREMEEALGDPSLGDDERASYMSVLTSHPGWLVRRWVGRFGAGEAFELMEANNRVPPLTLRVNSLRAEREEVMAELKGLGIEAQEGRHAPGAVRLKGTAPFSAFSKALAAMVSVQDEAAQLVSLMLAPRPGERILDACAAPGGKATHMAELMGDSGEVVAVDTDEARLELLSENAARLGLKSIKALKADARVLEAGGGFDGIMLDAPCSALGVIRRNPDVKYRHHEGAPAAFGARQLELLSKTARMLRPGGRIMFCTCSTEPEEGEEVVREFLRSYGDFYIINEVPPPPGAFVRDGFMRTWPHRDGTDGFFGAMICRRP